MKNSKKLFCAAFLFLLTSWLLLLPLQASAADQHITLNVKNGSDISDAFNAATKSARSCSGDTYITIPAGSYTAGSQLKVWSNTHISMNGVTIKKTSASNTMLRLGNKSDWEAANNGAGYSGYSGYSNISFEGGTWDGGGYSQQIMRFGHSTNITIKNATFRNVKDTHHMEFGACKNVTITGCTFCDFTGTWSSSTNREALQFETLAAGSGHFSAYNPNGDETPCQNVTISGCTFRNLERGIGTHTAIANSYFTNFYITNNTFENITGYAISAFNYKDSVISWNKISNCGSGIRFWTMDRNGAKKFYSSAKNSNSRAKAETMNSYITQNTISITAGYKATYSGSKYHYGIQLYGAKFSKKTGNAPAGDWRVSGVTVSSNTITMNYKYSYGIMMEGAYNDKIEGNKITSAKTSGIYASGSTSVALKSNTLTKCKIGITAASKSNITETGTVYKSCKKKKSFKGSSKINGKKK